MEISYGDHSCVSSSDGVVREPGKMAQRLGPKKEVGSAMKKWPPLPGEDRDPTEGCAGCRVWLPGGSEV